MTEPRPIRVAVVEDDADIRAGLSLLLEGTPGYACAGAWGSCEEALPELSANPPDVVVMDIQLPGCSGIEGVRALKASRPEIDVLMLSVREDDEAVFESLCAGACGYLVKTAASQHLLRAIDELHAGGAPMSPKIARMVAESFRRAPADAAASPLSPRETEILRLLCQAKPYKRIAAELHISVGTVHTHIKRIYRKLQVNSQAEAMIQAFRKRLV